jgi:hypothetical protein
VTQLIRKPSGGASSKDAGSRKKNKNASVGLRKFDGGMRN